MWLDSLDSSADTSEARESVVREMRSIMAMHCNCIGSLACADLTEEEREFHTMCCCTSFQHMQALHACRGIGGWGSRFSLKG